MAGSYSPHGLYDVRKIPTTSVATIALAFPEEAVVQDKEGTDFLSLEVATIRLRRARDASEWPTTTPKGKVLLRAFVGHAGDEAVGIYQTMRLKNCIA